MTDEQLQQRFTQIAQALEHLLAASDKHATEMADIRKAQAEFAENDRKLQARIEAIAEVTNKNSEVIANLEQQWQAYLRTLRPQ